MIDEVAALTERVAQTQHGFGDIRRAADELKAGDAPEHRAEFANALFTSEVHQARMLAVLLYGELAPSDPQALRFLQEQASADPDWRVQEMLAQAFDGYCLAIGYQQALPLISAWLRSERATLRRAASEGPRIWTTRPYFRDHPAEAIGLLKILRADSSEYVRKSCGNALRDISRQHPDLVRAELATWDRTDKSVAQTYKLAAKFIQVQ